jgi:hypothetical protein
LKDMNQEQQSKSRIIAQCTKCRMRLVRLLHILSNWSGFLDFDLFAHLLFFLFGRVLESVCERGLALHGCAYWIMWVPFTPFPYVLLPIISVPHVLFIPASCYHSGISYMSCYQLYHLCPAYHYVLLPCIPVPYVLLILIPVTTHTHPYVLLPDLSCYHSYLFLMSRLPLVLLPLIPILISCSLLCPATTHICSLCPAYPLVLLPPILSLCPAYHSCLFLPYLFLVSCLLICPAMAHICSLCPAYLCVLL